MAAVSGGQPPARIILALGWEKIPGTLKNQGVAYIWWSNPADRGEGMADVDSILYRVENLLEL